MATWIVHLRIAENLLDEIRTDGLHSLLEAMRIR